jgi:peptidoglycan hydrolase-like protein with peptidoglycan-binding domain
MKKIARGRAFRLALSAALAGTFGVAAAVASPQAALAATPHCNAETYYRSTQIDRNVWLPGYGSNRVCQLSTGDSGDGVRSLQVALVQCYSKGISVDGIFGPATASALRQAQSTAGTGADGIYGTNTRKALKFPIAGDDADRSCYRTS